MKEDYCLPGINFAFCLSNERKVTAMGKSIKRIKAGRE